MRQSPIDSAVEFTVVLPGQEAGLVIKVTEILDSWVEGDVVTLTDQTGGMYSGETAVKDTEDILTFRYDFFDADGVTPSELYGSAVEYVEVVADPSIEVADDLYDRLNSMLATHQFLALGPGVGTELFEDTLTGRGGAAVPNAHVRVFPYDTDLEVADFDTVVGGDMTDASGDYHLWLDPGSYARRVWKNGLVILDDLITIP